MLNLGGCGTEGDPLVKTFSLSLLKVLKSQSLNKLIDQLKRAKSRIFSYKSWDSLEKTEIFETFQQRKQVLDRACSIARRIHVDSRAYTFQERKKLQSNVNAIDSELQESNACVPRLADKTQKQEHFFNDTFKFSVCLPTKTGCTNWQRGLGEEKMKI